MHQWTSRLLAVMMSAAMTVSVITPTAIFAAPASPSGKADEAVNQTADVPEVEIVDIAEDDEALSAVVEGSLGVTELPELNQDNLAGIMAERIAATKTDSTVIPMLWQGLLEQKIMVGEEVRTAKIYVPENTPQGASFVLMNVPEGQTNTIGWMYNSGWVQAADSYGFCLFVLEPGEGGWKTVEEELPYFQEGYRAERNGVYLMPAPSVYVVGYGNMGSNLQKIAMENPLSIAAAAFIGANEIDDAFLAEMAEKSFDRPDRNYGVMYKEVPVPVMLSNTDEKLLNYWKGVSSADKVADSKETYTFWQQSKDSIFTPEGNIVLVGSIQGVPSVGTIASFFNRFYRYGGGPKSNMIARKVNYEELGVDFRSFTDSNGIEREYMVYVPEYLRGTENDAPLVVAYHGAQTSMRNFFENTLYYRLANANRFIVVFPESTLIPVAPALTGGVTKAYRPLWQLENPDMIDTEEVYADELLDDIIANYNVDESRIYCTGHSMGSMMTNYLGTSKVSDRFAACGATSGPLNGEASYNYEEAVPMFLTMAEYDMWPYDISGETGVSKAVDNWLIRNGLATADDVAEVRANPDDEFVEGRYNNSVWKNENGVPVVRYAWVTAKDHVNIVDENKTIWEQWFSKWHKTGNGNRAYESKVQPTKLTEANVPQIDRTRGMVLPLTGYLSQDVQVGDETRTASLYIGKGAPIRCYMSIINAPDGVDTYEFLKATGWIDLMDERKEGVFVLEPGEGGWGTADEEQAYIETAMDAYNTRKWYSNYGESYAVGYGTGGSALQQYVMFKPTAFIAGTFINASSISKEFMDENAATVNDVQTEILKGTIPVSVFEYGTNADVAAYWLSANHCAGEGQAVEGGTLYTQSEDCLQTSYTKGVKSTVFISGASVDASKPEFTKDIYEKMAVYTRYENTWANGNALMLRPDYEKLGVKFYDYDQDGFKRSYMVYKPASAPEENIPVVYVMAGNTQSMTVFFDCTSWWQVADDYGFMIVLPSEQFNTAVDLTWNITGYQAGSETAIADDVQFLKDVIAEVDKNYNTDTSRRYVTGQSFGSMWTNYCALHMSDYFTAFGSTSGPISFDIDGTEDTDVVPVWLYAGEHDIFDWDFTKDVTEGFSLKKTVEYYLDRDDLGGLQDYKKTTEGRYTNYTWSNEEGIPLYVYTQTEGRNHNCVPSEPRMIWEKWFSKWTKDGAGVRSYEGTPVASRRGALTPVHLTDEAFANAEYVGQKNPFTGYFYTEITVGGENKNIKFYIPKNSHWALYYVLMNAPEGMSADEFLVTSGWAQLAEQEQFGIVIMDESFKSVADGEAYIEAAYRFMSGGKFFKPGTSYYAVGYGKTGNMIEQFVMKNPMTFGSAAFVDAGDMSYTTIRAIGNERADSRTAVLKGEVPTPAYIVEADIAGAKNIIDYWKAVNYVGEDAEDGAHGEAVYTQAEDTMFTTHFNNLKVATLEKDADYGDTDLARGIWDFMKEYFTYGSVATGWITGERADYKKLGVQFKTFEQDGYLREYMVYVPESAAAKDAAPAIFVAPGAGSTDTFMFDTSMWWKVAQDNGFIVVELTAPVTGNSTTSLHAVSWDNKTDRDLKYISAVVDQVKEQYKVDASRLYFTGQSQGSVLSHYVGMNLPELFAAIGSTSAGINAGMVEVNDSITPVPYKLIVGEFDVMGWDFSGKDAQTRKTVAHWVRTNKGGIPDSGYDTVDTLGDGGRYVSYIWSNSQDIPVFDFTECHGRGHSVVVTDMVELWKWFEHYSQDEKDNTYYDGKLIDFSDKMEAVDVATLEAPKVDFTRGNRQEYTGYYKQSIEVNEASRTVKYYIPEDMRIRGYFNIITVPEEIDTEAFLIESGWRDIADETGDGLVILEPVAGAWGSLDAEKAYVDAAIKTFESGAYFKLFGEHYLVGYEGNGGAALQMYAAENPLRVISAAFVNASNIGSEFFEEAGKATLPYSPAAMSEVTKAEVPVPVIIIDKDPSKAETALSYWKKANAVEETPITDDNIKVYYQVDSKSSIVTAYKDVYSYVGEVVLKSAVTDKDLTEFIHKNLSGFTRYENNYIGGNVLNYRAELDDEEHFKTVKFNQTFEGVTYAREYIVYVPDSVKSPAPVVYVFPGGSQTDNVFIDATGWWQVAQENGFILVMTMAQEGGPMSPSWKITDNSYDIDYMKQVIAQVDEAYDTDPSRRYCTGQSMGSLMSEQSAIEMPEYYAAIGSTSACMSKEQIGAYADPAEGIIPYYLILGEYDVDNWDFQQTGEDMNKCSTIVSYLLGRNGFTDASGFDNKVVDGRYTTYVWNNAAGQPLFKFGQTALRNHNCVQTEMPMLYEWFSHWSLENGVRKYDGVAVGTQVEKDPVSEFVGNLYATCLGRTGADHEIATWADLLKAGDVTGAKTAYGFFFSPEYVGAKKDNRAYVTDLYKAIMGREPDTEGLETWISYLEKGTSREKVFAGFVNSDEFKADCAAHNIKPGTYRSDRAVDVNPDVTAFVVRMYKVALNRDFDALGLEEWTFSLINKQATGSRIAEGFLLSEEFKNRGLSDEEFVTVLYHTMFDREPDTDGFNAWVKALKEGASREQVLKGFTKSVEFANLCGSFGIEQ
jgi:poly(3-hydroxybutyrate) depolymerase